MQQENKKGVKSGPATEQKGGGGVLTNRTKREGSVVNQHQKGGMWRTNHKIRGSLLSCNVTLYPCPFLKKKKTLSPTSASIDFGFVGNCVGNPHAIQVTRDKLLHVRPSLKPGQYCATSRS